MRNVTMQAQIGHDVLADVRVIRVPITFIVGGWDVPIVCNGARFSRAAVAGRVIVEPNAPHGAGILRRGVREFLKGHPHVATIAEAPQNEGGQGATLVELRQ